MSTDKQKRYRDRANRNWRALRKEQEKFGAISDGSGKRYLAGIYYVLAGDPEKSQAYFEWFESELSDDVGEPVFLLCWALAAREYGDSKEARYRFQLAMLSNLYMVPYLLGRPVEEFDMWHPSNLDQTDYIFEVEDWLTDIPQEVIPWLEAEYETPAAVKLRHEYINTYRALKTTKELNERQRLLQKWYKYSEVHLGTSG